MLLHKRRNRLIISFLCLLNSKIFISPFATSVVRLNPFSYLKKQLFPVGTNIENTLFVIYPERYSVLKGNAYKAIINCHFFS